MTTEETAPEDVALSDHPERMLKWFRYSHLPPDLRAVSKPFAELALSLCTTVPDGTAEPKDVPPGAASPGPERTTALRKLLEAKDAAVRARLIPGG